MELMEILKSAVEKKASDIFIISGLAVTYKENGIITKQNDNMILPAEAEKLIKRNIPSCRKGYIKIRGNGRR